MKIGLVVYSDCLPAGLFGFSDVLMAANRRAGRRLFSFCWLSEQGGDTSTANGLNLATEQIGASTIDAVLVPGAWRDAHTALTDEDLGLVEALSELPPSTRFWSYCTGVLLVARTGRLNGCPATTTWWLRELAGKQFTSVQWRFHQTLVQDPHCSTASGVNGYLPLALAILERQCGPTMVEDIRRHMVLPRPESRQTPLQDVPVLVQRSGWLRELIQQIETARPTELDIPRLAAAMNTSPRTLQRRVLQESGYRCGELMRLVKMNQVGELLVSTDRPLAAICNTLGYPDDASLRRSFRQVSGLTPRAYRNHP